MLYRYLGKTNEKLSSIGIGTWKLGIDPEMETKAIRRGLSLGINFIDTAEMYNTEPLVGAAARDSSAFIATKVSPDHFSREKVIKSCDTSLEKLGVKCIDLYQLHWPNPRIKISETMSAMEQLVKDGKIRYIGVSNFSIAELKEAQAALKDNVIVSNQIEYSMLVRSAEEGMLEYCRKEGISIIAYSPLARGAIAKNKELMDRLAEIGSRLGMNPFQVALAWTIRHDNVIAIPKAADIKHMEENAAAASKSLGKKDIDSINHFLGSTA
jgi:diketogulonate reductase-like aldo/keto reductase